MFSQNYSSKLLTGLVVGITGTGKTNLATDQIKTAYEAGDIIVILTNKRSQLADLRERTEKKLKLTATQIARDVTVNQSGNNFNENAKIIFSLHVYFKPWGPGGGVSKFAHWVQENADYVIFDEAIDLPKQLEQKLPSKHITLRERPQVYKDFENYDNEVFKFEKNNFGWGYKCLLKKGERELTGQIVPSQPRQNGTTFDEQTLNMKATESMRLPGQLINEPRQINNSKPIVIAKEQIFKLDVNKFNNEYGNELAISESAEIEEFTLSLHHQQTGEELTLNQIILKIISNDLVPALSFLKTNTFGKVVIFDPAPLLWLKDKKLLFLSPEEPDKRLSKILKETMGEDYPIKRLTAIPHIEKLKIIISPAKADFKNGLYSKVGDIGEVIDEVLKAKMVEELGGNWKAFPWPKTLLLTVDKKRLDKLAIDAEKLGLWQDKRIAKNHEDFNFYQPLGNFANATYYGNDKLSGLNIGEILTMFIDLNKLEKMPMQERFFTHDKDAVFKSTLKQAIGRMLRPPFLNDENRNWPIIKTIVLWGSTPEKREEYAEALKNYMSEHVINGISGVEIINKEDDKRTPWRLNTIYNSYFAEELKSFASCLFLNPEKAQEIDGEISARFKAIDGELTEWQKKQDDQEETGGYSIKRRTKKLTQEEMWKNLKEGVKGTTQKAPTKPILEGNKEVRSNEIKPTADKSPEFHPNPPGKPKRIIKIEHIKGESISDTVARFNKLKAEDDAKAKKEEEATAEAEADAREQADNDAWGGQQDDGGDNGSDQY